MIIPGGLGGHPLMYIIERYSADLCRFVIVNTSPHRGLGFHESSAQSPPKITYVEIHLVTDALN